MWNWNGRKEVKEHQSRQRLCFYLQINGVARTMLAMEDTVLQ
jgi:hypothetical protein